MLTNYDSHTVRVRKAADISFEWKERAGINKLKSLAEIQLDYALN